jgi:hypothetical protein
LGKVESIHLKSKTTIFLSIQNVLDILKEIMETGREYLDLKKVNGPNQVALQILIIDAYCQSYAKIGRGYRRD